MVMFYMFFFAVLVLLYLFCLLLRVFVLSCCSSFLVVAWCVTASFEGTGTSTNCRSTRENPSKITQHLRDRCKPHFKFLTIWSFSRLRQWYEERLGFTGDCYPLKPGQTVFRRCRKRRSVKGEGTFVRWEVERVGELSGLIWSSFSFQFVCFLDVRGFWRFVSSSLVYRGLD